jgi:hypothetical protein
MKGGIMFSTTAARAGATIAAALLVAALGAGRAHAAPDAQLLRTYQPVLRLDPAERFGPTSVQAFVTDSSLERLESGSWVVVDPDVGPGGLPGPGTGTWRLNEDACTPALPLGGLGCYAAADDAGPQASVVYGRVARLADATVLQYWYFYYDDVYSYLYPPSDFIWQAHEGDWEVVNVVLGPDELPVETGYSQHCLGQRRAWADTPRWDGTHPVVWVAVGSHANYFAPGVHPIQPACVPPQALALLAQAHLPPPADYASAAGPGETAGPPQAGDRVTVVEPANEDAKHWLAFPGFWGELQYFHAPPPVGPGTVPLGTSPVGPAYHDVWIDPLGTLALWPEG